MSVTPNERQRILDENLRLIEATWTCFRKLFPTMFACWKELVRRLDEIVESCDHCGEKLEIGEAHFAICALELRMYVSPLVTIMGKLLNPADGWRR